MWRVPITPVLRPSSGTSVGVARLRCHVVPPVCRQLFSIASQLPVQEVRLVKHMRSQCFSRCSTERDEDAQSRFRSQGNEAIKITRVGMCVNVAMAATKVHCSHYCQCNQWNGLWTRGVGLLMLTPSRGGWVCRLFVCFSFLFF